MVLTFWLPVQHVYVAAKEETKAVLAGDSLPEISEALS